MKAKERRKSLGLGSLLVLWLPRPGTVFFLFFVVNAFMTVSIFGGTLLGELYPCQGNHNGTVTLFRADEPMALCCRLTDENAVCPGGMRLYRDNPEADPARHMNKTEGPECLVQLIIHQAAVSDQGMYKCSLHEDVLAVADITVVERPGRLELKSFSLGLTSTSDVSVVFVPGAPDDRLSPDNYTVKVDKTLQTLPSRCSNVVLCEPDHTPVVCREGLCTCKSSLTLSCPRVIPLTLTLSVSRILFPGIDSQFNVTTQEHLVPDKPVGVSVEPQSHSAMLNLDLREYSTIYQHMEVSGYPLWVSVSLSKEDGYMETTDLGLKATNNGVLWSTLTNMRVELRGLVPHTNYTVQVVLAAGRGPLTGWTDSVAFHTTQTVPAHSPVLHEFDFSRSSPHSNSSHSLYIQWQRLPHEAQGAGNLVYVVELSEESGSLVDTLITASSHAEFTGVPARLLIAKVWARNSVGSSKDFSELQIPFLDGLEPTIHTEYFDRVGQARVIALLKGVSSPESVAVHTCVWSDGTVCQEYTSSRLINLTGDRIDVDTRLTQECTTNLLVTNLTMPAYWIYEDDLTFERLEPPYAENVPAQVNTRKRHPVLQEREISENFCEGLNWPGDITRADYPAVLLSVKSGGMWSGMFPSTCLYDRSLRNLALRQLS